MIETRYAKEFSVKDSERNLALAQQQLMEAMEELYPIGTIVFVFLNSRQKTPSQAEITGYYVGKYSEYQVKLKKNGRHKYIHRDQIMTAQCLPGDHNG